MKSQFVKLALSLTILLISLLLISCTNRRREAFTSGSICYGSLSACQTGTTAYKASGGTCMTGPACILGDQSCYGTLDACNASNIGYRPSADCKSGPACIGETGCYGLQTECQQMACIGITDSTLAKDIPVPCLQQTWLNAGCTKTGSWYPIDNYNGWWKASPSGSTMVYCYGDQVPGNSPGNCGAGTFGVVNATMKYLASRDTAAHIAQCGN